MSEKSRILILDDEKNYLLVLEALLSDAGYDVTPINDPEMAVSYMEEAEVDVVITDMKMPKMSGLDVLQQIKRSSPSIPVLIMTAFGSIESAVEVMKYGAFDYITKPFNPLEVTARVKTVLRRCRRGAETIDEMDIRGLTINRASRRCRLFGRELALTPTEFDILWYLCDNAGRVVASEELFEAVWKEKFLTSSSNTVMAHIGRLREKMHEPARKPKFIKTVWGVGYEIEK